jgi:HEPN domain-containing protein
VNRNDLKLLAEVRLREAKALLNKKYYDGAYYLTGYAVECALKSCIAKKTRKYDFPDRDLARKSYTHNLKELVGVSGLERDLDIETQRDPDFEVNWAIIKDWKESSRYERHEAATAKSLYRAVADSKHGVLRWLKHHW